jgi:hypothetical protein
MRSHHSFSCLGLCLGALVLGCDPDTEEPADETGAATGGAATESCHHEISMETWIYDSGEFGVTTTNIMQFDNEAEWVAGEDAGAPGTFVRFDWTYDGEGALWYCTTVFDATTLQDAIDAPRSDDSAPADGGCGGMFLCTTLTPA